MKKLTIALSGLLICLASFSQGGMLQFSSRISQKGELGIEVRGLCIYNPVYTMLTYSNTEKIFSVSAGIGHISEQENKNRTIWGIGPQADIVNQTEALEKHQNFLGGSTFLIKKYEAFNLEIYTSFSKSLKKREPHLMGKKFDLSLCISKRITRYLSAGFSAHLDINI